MTENILIEFSSDVKGITTAEEAVGQLAGVDKTLQETFVQTNAALKARDSLASTLSGSLGSLTGKLQNAEKAALGAFGTKGLQQFQTSLVTNTNLVKLLGTSISAASEKLKTLSAGSSEYKQLNAEIQHSVDLFKKLTVEQENAHKASVRAGQEQESQFVRLTERVVEYLGIYEAIYKIQEFFSGAIEEANKLEQSTTRLKNTLSNIGRTDVFEGLIKKSEEFAKTFKYLDGADVTEVFQQLITYGKLTEKQITDLTPVIINFAAKSGLTINESASIIIRALEGNARALKDYGINLKDGKDATERFGIVMDTLAPKVEGAAAAFEKTSAGIKAISEQDIRHLQEEIGTELLPTMNKFYQSVYYVIQGIGSIASTVGNGIKNVFSQLTSGLGLLNIIDAVFKKQDDAITKNIANQKELAEARKTADSVAADAATKPLKLQQDLLRQNNALKEASFKNYNDLVSAGKQFTAEGHKAALQLYTDNQVVLALQKTIAQSQDKRVLGNGDPDDKKEKEIKHVKDISDAVKELRKELTTLANEQAIGQITPKEADIDRVKAYDKAFKDIFNLGGNANTPIVKKLQVELAPIDQRVLEQKIHDLVSKANKLTEPLAAPKDTSDELRKLIIKNTEEANQKLLELGNDAYSKDLENQTALFTKKLINEKEYRKNIEELEKRHAIFAIQIDVNTGEAKVENLKSQGLNFQKEEEKLAADRVRLAKATARDLTDIENEQARKKQLIQQLTYDAITGTGSAFFDNLKASYDRDSQANQNLLNSKLITQTEFAKRQKQIQKEQAAIDKEKAVFDVLIQGAKAIFEIEARAAVYTAALNPVAAAIALSQIPVVLTEEGIQIALIAARKYKHGKVNIDGPGTETSDSIPAMLSRNESVINAAATKKYQPALEAINNMEFDKYLAKLAPPNFVLPEMNFPKFEMFQMPTMAPLPKWAKRNNSPHAPIDIEALSEAIASKIVEKQGKIEDIPGLDLNIDKDGIYIAAREGINRTEYNNRRYGYKG